MKKLLVLGEVLGDVFPEQVKVGGAPYNVARHCQAFGLAPLLMTAVGQDALGERVLQEMTTAGLASTGVQSVQDAPTGVVQVHFSQAGHQFEILDHQAYDAMDAQWMLATMQAYAPDVVYVGSLAMRHAPMQAAMQVCMQATSASVFCDINLRAPWYDANSLRCVLQAADMLKINHEELVEVTRVLGLPNSPDLNSLARQLLSVFALTEVYVTCADQGSFWLNAYGDGLRVPPMQLQTPFIDSVGAGDAYSAVLLRGLLAGWSRQTMLTRAAWFATAMCGVRGAVPEANSFYMDFV